MENSGADILPRWNADDMAERIPGLNLALVGGRRQGKSTATAHLLWKFAKKFDLVIAFVGSANCNPVLSALMERFWDPRFFFPQWNCALIARLLEQQESNRARSVLILVDDVVLTSKAQEQISTLAMRGRHFKCSLWCAAVSYVTLPKQVRRSLDVLMVFSLPMKGDLKVLSWEYTSNTRVAEFALQRLKQHQCLVLQTLTKKQRLSLWSAVVFGPDTVRNLQHTAHDILRTRVSRARPSERSRAPRQSETCAAPGSTRLLEESPVVSGQTAESLCAESRRSAPLDQSLAPASSGPTRTVSGD